MPTGVLHEHLQRRVGGIEVLNPLPMVLNAFRPTTGYDDVKMVALARLAVERDCGRFEWSVLDWNANAIAFYEKMGADVLPDWRICRVTGEALTALASNR